MSSNQNGSPNTPWKNGYYQSSATPGTLVFVEGEKSCFFPASGIPTNIKDNPMLNGTLKFGDFGEPHPDVVTKTGVNRANLEITAFAGSFKATAVLSDDGTRFTFYGMQFIA